jgi:glycine cleavage system regulatory protein
MREQLARTDATPEHKAACGAKLDVMAVQKADLAEELSKLVSDVAAGRVKLKVYRQFKMYNDPRYRTGAAAK